MDKKQISKKIFSYILKSKTFIFSIIVTIIFLVFFPSIIYFITIEDGTYTEDDWENVPYVSSTYTRNATITHNGIETTSTAQELWDRIIQEGGNVDEYLDSPEELEKLMNAELITQYPRIGNGNLDGIVEFERHKSDGTSLTLQYIDLNTFNNYINSNDPQVLNYFTLDENENALIAVVNKTTEELSGNDDEIIISEYSDMITEDNKEGENNYKRIEYNISVQPIHYKDYLQKYTMPFQYLWAFLVVTEDKDFVLELSELVQNSQITISIYDNITTTINEDVFTYKKESRTDTYAKVEPVEDYGVTGYPEERYWVGEENEHYDSRYPADYYIDDTEYAVTHRFTYESDTTVIDLTNADVWIVKLDKQYTYQSSTNETQDTNERDLEDTSYEEMDDSPEISDTNIDLLEIEKAQDLVEEAKKYIEDNLPEGNNTVSNNVSNNSMTNNTNISDDSVENAEVDVDISYVECSYYKHRINRKQTSTTTTSNQIYIAGPSSITQKVDANSSEPNFVTIFCSANNRQAREVTLEISEWLFEIIETNDDTKNMLELTKYLLYKATNQDYGTTSFDFSEYERNNFSISTGGIYGDSIQEKVWFLLKDLGFSDIAAAGAMGNFHYESGTFEPTKVESGYTEVNGGIGICQWTNSSRGAEGRNTNLKRYAESKGKSWQDEDIQVNFLRAELGGGGDASQYANKQLLDRREFYGFDLAYEDGWINSTTVEDATKAFCYSFERPNASAASSSMNQRIEYAQSYYQQYSGRTMLEEIETELTGDNKVKMQQMIAEAKRIANDDTYKYSQDFRETEYYYDCSSFVSRLYLQYFSIPRLDYGSAGRGTDNIRAKCEANYTEIPMTELKSGDILWRDGHVALYAGNNQTVEAVGDVEGIQVKTKGNFTKAFRVIR